MFRIIINGWEEEKKITVPEMFSGELLIKAKVRY